MRIQGHLRDHSLPDLLATLSDRRETGCLHIEFEPEPAFLYFKDGQLVDARMSFLKGLAAVHLAFSRAKAAFDFDNAVEPPASAITDENERLLLSGILRVKLSNVVEAETLSSAPEEEVASSSNADQNPESPIVSPPALEQATNLSMPIAVVPTPAPQTLEPQRRFENPNRFVVRWRPTIRNLARQKLLRSAAVILVIAVPATVGITVLLGKKDSTVPLAFAATQPLAEPEKKQSTDNIKQSPPGNSVPAPHVATVAKPINPPAREIAYEKPKLVKETPRETIKDSSPDVPDDTAAAERISKTIVVEVHVEEGRVTEAWVKNSNKALAAYEATAIRLARQRRYSADTTRTESVSVDVSVEK